MNPNHVNHVNPVQKTKTFRLDARILRWGSSTAVCSAEPNLRRVCVCVCCVYRYAKRRFGEVQRASQRGGKNAYNSKKKKVKWG